MAEQHIVKQFDDLYAHEVFSTPAFDGLLVSKGIVDGFGAPDEEPDPWVFLGCYLYNFDATAPIDPIALFRKRFGDVEMIAGNVATAEATEALIDHFDHLASLGYTYFCSPGACCFSATTRCALYDGSSSVRQAGRQSLSQQQARCVGRYWSTIRAMKSSSPRTAFTGVPS